MLSYTGHLQLLHVRIFLVAHMRLEIFPYKFRGKASAATLHRRGSGVIELKGAAALCGLYMSGVSFRLMPDSPIDAVVFDLDELSVEDSQKLDQYCADNAFVVKSPSAVLMVPGKENRRKVFYDLSKEYPYAEYAQAYGNAFMQFTIEAGLGAVPYDHCMDSPRQMTFGRPDPDMTGSCCKVDVKGLGVMRVPMPLSRYDAKELFGIDAKLMLPSVEYFYKGKVGKGERYEFIWKKIVPAAFAWYRFFETNTESRWGLNENKFEFKDCVKAIEREMARIGIPMEEMAAVVRGNLNTAYAHFKAPPLVAYSPRTGKVGPDYWDKISDGRKRSIYARHNETARERRRMKRILQGRKRTPGRKPTMIIETLDDLERLWSEGAISKPYYYRKRKEMA